MVKNLIRIFSQIFEMFLKVTFFTFSGKQKKKFVVKVKGETTLGQTDRQFVRQMGK